MWSRKNLMLLASLVGVGVLVLLFAVTRQGDGLDAIYAYSDLETALTEVIAEEELRFSQMRETAEHLMAIPKDVLRHYETHGFSGDTIREGNSTMFIVAENEETEIAFRYPIVQGTVSRVTIYSGNDQDELGERVKEQLQAKLPGIIVRREDRDHFLETHETVADDRAKQRKN